MHHLIADTSQQERLHCAQPVGTEHDETSARGSCGFKDHVRGPPFPNRDTDIPAGRRKERLELWKKLVGLSLQQGPYLLVIPINECGRKVRVRIGFDVQDVQDLYLGPGKALLERLCRLFSMQGLVDSQ